MANELTLDVKASLANAGTEITFPDAAARSISINVDGDRFVHQRQQIGTSEEALGLGDIAAGGYFFAINRDATNFISLRAATGATPLVKLKPGELCAFRLSPLATAPFAIADTAAAELEYWLLAD